MCLHPLLEQCFYTVDTIIRCNTKENTDHLSTNTFKLAKKEEVDHNETIIIVIILAGIHNGLPLQYIVILLGIDKNRSRRR